MSDIRNEMINLMRMCRGFLMQKKSVSLVTVETQQEIESIVKMNNGKSYRIRIEPIS